MSSGRENKKEKDGDQTASGQDSTLRLDSDQEDLDIPKRYAASLVIKTGPKKDAEYSITSGRTVIGRGTGSDIIIDDPAVSRMHSAIEFSKNKFVLKDLGSTNGTFMDGNSIKQSDLVHGSRFQLGAVVIEFALVEKRGESVYVIE
jgi:pSer/pThr/pTyr-binding forkhead associated (FHA) protein